MVSLDYRDASRRRRWLLWLPRWSVPFSVCSYVHYSAMKPTCTTCTRHRLGGRTAAGRRRGGSRESQHVGASTAHGRRSGTRCRGKATVHAATGRATTRASACDVRTAQQTRARARRAARRSLRPHGASWHLISSEGACLCPRAPPCSLPCPMTDAGANHGHDRGPGWRRSCRLGCAGATPPTAALDVRARGHEPCAVQPHSHPRSTSSSASGRSLSCTPPLPVRAAGGTHAAGGVRERPWRIREGLRPNPSPDLCFYTRFWALGSSRFWALGSSL